MGYNSATMEWGSPRKVPFPGIGPKLNEIKPSRLAGEIIIEYMLPQAYEVQVQILDMNGRLIRSLLRAEPCRCMPPAGIHQVVWDGLDEDGKRVRPGRYQCRFISGDYSETMEVDIER